MKQNINIYIQNNKIIIGNVMHIKNGVVKINVGIRPQDVYYVVDDVYRKKESIQINEMEGQNVLAYFTKELKVIEAGGGIVWNENDELLMIHRNGVWDLPKGKLEKNEDIEDCAWREVAEETNCKNLSIKNFASHTYHIYQIKEKYVLKKTHWYVMQAPTQDLIPQTEEGITEVKWIAKADLPSYVANSYDNIKDVLAGYL
jgi:ADP-ribose pyrophosphatase YjhB (NUDIX family)